jgi:hypothetical protein
MPSVIKLGSDCRTSVPAAADIPTLRSPANFLAELPMASAQLALHLHQQQFGGLFHQFSHCHIFGPTISHPTHY